MRCQSGIITVVEVILKILLIAGLVSLNAFFVAAEYSLLSVRRTRIEQLAREGRSAARLAQALLADMGVLFSGLQLGITIASVLMGWLGESILSNAIEMKLEGHLHHYLSVAIAHTIAITTAFVVVTTILMVLGELVPKTVAYGRAERVVLLVARPTTWFLQLTRAPVKLLEALSNLVLRALGEWPGGGHRGVHTMEEVKLIVSAIRQRGLLGEEQEEMIHGVFDLHRILVREVMVPWPRVSSLPLTHDLNVLLQQVIKDQHSRVPVYEGSPDHILGILFTKDLLYEASKRIRYSVPGDRPLDLRLLLHQPMIVPENMPLSKMLEEVRRKHLQMALVVDEFGTYVGLITIEDVLEQIVGEIQDEYDLEEKSIQPLDENVLVLDASLGLRELSDDYGIELPRGAGYETLAGFLLARLGSIPKGGEAFIFEGRRFTVVQMDGRRIATVRIERTRPVAPQPGVRG
jgi:CBS domain containing-hemolysin-like protein